MVNNNSTGSSGLAVYIYYNDVNDIDYILNIIGSELTMLKQLVDIDISFVPVVKASADYDKAPFCFFKTNRKNMRYYGIESMKEAILNLRKEYAGR